MGNKEHLQAIANQIERVVFDYISAQEKIENYRINEIKEVSIKEFKEEPNLKDLFTGKSSTAFVTGNIRLYYWLGENSSSKLDLSFEAKNLNIYYNSETDQFIVDNHFQFVPLIK